MGVNVVKRDLSYTLARVRHTRQFVGLAYSKSQMQIKQGVKKLTPYWQGFDKVFREVLGRYFRFCHLWQKNIIFKCHYPNIRRIIPRKNPAITKIKIPFQTLAPLG